VRSPGSRPSEHPGRAAPDGQADAWVRGFLAIAVLSPTTSEFPLAKVVRDRQEKMPADHDPYRKP
jgi:hypothetical protein